jgi:hypothetical protein
MIRGVTYILKNDTTLQGEVGQNKAGTKYKVFPTTCGQAEEAPYVIVRLQNMTPYHCKQGVTTTFSGSFIVSSYNKNFEETEDMDRAVRDALWRTRGTFNAVVFQDIIYEDTSDDFDYDRQLFVRTSRFTATVDDDQTT